MFRLLLKKLSFVTVFSLYFTLMHQAVAQQWNDTAIMLSYGTHFSEPFKNNADGSSFDIDKYIISLVHSSSYRYGSNFVQVNLHHSNNEPNSNASGQGAQEAYAIYRHYFDYEKLMGQLEHKPSFIQNFGLIAGFDWNNKNDDYGSHRQMWVVGPSIYFNVPGILSLSSLGYFESNQANILETRYRYDPYFALQLVWDMPIKNTGLEFKGTSIWMSSKGKNEFGDKTKPELFIDTSLMYDLGRSFHIKTQTFKIGPAYQYWKNKYGNNTQASAGKGATSRVPMLRVQYHF